MIKKKEDNLKELNPLEEYEDLNSNIEIKNLNNDYREDKLDSFSISLELD